MCHKTSNVNGYSTEKHCDGYYDTLITIKIHRAQTFTAGVFGIDDVIFKIISNINTIRRMMCI